MHKKYYTYKVLNLLYFLEEETNLEKRERLNNFPKFTELINDKARV